VVSVCVCAGVSVWVCVSHSQVLFSVPHYISTLSFKSCTYNALNQTAPGSFKRIICSSNFFDQNLLHFCLKCLKTFEKHHSLLKEVYPKNVSTQWIANKQTNKHCCLSYSSWEWEREERSFPSWHYQTLNFSPFWAEPHFSQQAVHWSEKLFSALAC